MSRRLDAQGCPQVHRRDLSKNPRACGPCGQPSHWTRNTVELAEHLFVVYRWCTASAGFRGNYDHWISPCTGRSCKNGIRARAKANRGRDCVERCARRESAGRAYAEPRFSPGSRRAFPARGRC
jgi:hypothetical protein